MPSLGKVWRRNSITLHCCRLEVGALPGDRGPVKLTQVADGGFSIQRDKTTRSLRRLTSLLFLNEQASQIRRRALRRPDSRRVPGRPPETAFRRRETHSLTRSFSWSTGIGGHSFCTFCDGQRRSDRRARASGRVGIQAKDRMTSAPWETGRPQSCSPMWGAVSISVWENPGLEGSSGSVRS